MTPLVQTTPPPPRSSDHAGVASASLPPVLVVEDDPAIRTMLVMILLGEGYAPIGAASGQAAITVLEADQGKPRLMLLDLLMDDGDGLSVLAWLRDHSLIAERTRVLIVTAGSTVLPAWTQPLVAATVRKPFDVDHLLARVLQATQGLR